ncbi:hypothetical protein Tco_0996405 [Tanacetum coccineum]
MGVSQRILVNRHRCIILVSVESSSAGVDIAAEDGVALLLRHSRGVQAMDDEVMHIGEGDKRADKGKKGKKKAKKVLGPERPSFLVRESDASR